jgi:hypothetical protein
MTDPQVVALPPGKLIVNTREEEHFPMKIKDWERLRAKALSIQKKRREFSAFAWGMVGLAITAVFSLVSWLAPFKSLSQTSQVEYAWVTPAYIATAVAGTLMAICAFWASHLFAKAEKLTAVELVSDMDAIFVSEPHVESRVRTSGLTLPQELRRSIRHP